MGGGGGGPTPQAAVPVPSAADEEAAAERARLYSLLRSRRGATGLMYGARPRVTLLGTKKTPAAQAAGDLVNLWSPILSGGSERDSGGWGGDFGGGPGTGSGPGGGPAGEGRGAGAGEGGDPE
jgi:hypothetical protein